MVLCHQQTAVLTDAFLVWYYGGASSTEIGLMDGSIFRLVTHSDGGKDCRPTNFVSACGCQVDDCVCRQTQQWHPFKSHYSDCWLVVTQSAYVSDSWFDAASASIVTTIFRDIAFAAADIITYHLIAEFNRPQRERNELTRLKVMDVRGKTQSFRSKISTSNRCPMRVYALELLTYIHEPHITEYPCRCAKIHLI